MTGGAAAQGSPRSPRRCRQFKRAIDNTSKRRAMYVSDSQIYTYRDDALVLADVSQASFISQCDYS